MLFRSGRREEEKKEREIEFKKEREEDREEERDGDFFLLGASLATCS